LSCGSRNNDERRYDVGGKNEKPEATSAVPKPANPLTNPAVKAPKANRKRT